MSKILGLDLGTNSIGWAVVEHSEVFNTKSGPRNKEEKFDLIDQGVHIFSEGVKIEKGNESSKAAERTAFRSARKLKFRRKLRKYETLKVLAENKMCPLSVGEVVEWRKSNFREYPMNEGFLKWHRTDEKTDYNPYKLRDTASREKMTRMELGRAFYHIAQRRGFLSNRLDNSDNSIIEEKKTEIEDIIKSCGNAAELARELEIYFSQYELSDEVYKPLGTLYNSFKKSIKSTTTFEELIEAVSNRLNRKENLGQVKESIVDLTQKIELANCETLGQYFYQLYNGNKHHKDNKIRNQYTAREEHYHQEFLKIAELQQLPNDLTNRLERAIFFQRPLKSQKGTVGKCSFEMNKPRCPVSHPLYEEYRMLSFINNIRMKPEGEGKFRRLSESEVASLIPKFYRKSRPHFDFEDLVKVLGPEHEFNHNLKTTVSGNPTSSALKTLIGDDWNERIFEYKTQDKDGVAKQHAIDYQDLWHILFTFDSSDKLKEFALTKLKLNENEAIQFSRINLKKDYASLSLKAIKKILPYLQDGLILPHAVFMANMEEVVDAQIWNIPNNQDRIRAAIRELIHDQNSYNKRVFMVNELLKRFKDEFGNNHSNYELDEEDRKRVNEKMADSYPSFSELQVDDQQALHTEITSLFEKQLRKNKFLSTKRIDERIKDFLKGVNNDGEVFCSDESRLDNLYHPSDIEVFRTEEPDHEGKILLGSPAIPAIKNPMAMRTMHQLRKLTNALLREELIDQNTKIHIELSRELNDANKRKAIQQRQRELEGERKANQEEIIKLYKAETGKEINPSDDDLLRFQLWKEQNQREIYEESGKNIAISDIIGANPKYDIEHTIPRSISNDNSQMNKTLCSKEYNRNIKKRHIPNELPNHEEILERVDHWEKGYNELNQRIDRLIRQTKSATTKDQKDRYIQDRHYLTLKRDYLKGKHNRFIWKEVKEGFKNSQLVDTGIITKYARAYLKSVFPKVYSVKGSMVDVFRKAWGLHDIEENDLGHKSYKPKDRSKHTHHCQDAITIACMTKTKYDSVAHAWGLEEQGHKNDARAILKELKPWPTFTSDVRNIGNQVLVSHHTPNSLKKQAKRKWRKRGKIQRNERGEVIYLQGDTVRGALHKETVYGAIVDPDNADQVKSVVRIELGKLKPSDVSKIVDPVVREKMENAVMEHGFKDVAGGKVIVWMNEEKQIPIKKIRCFAPSVTSPIKLKEHRDKSTSPHKSHKLVQNDENYCIAIYELIDQKGNAKRTFETVKNIDAGEYFKASNASYRKDHPIVLSNDAKKGYPLRTILIKGQSVLFYDQSPEEIWDLTSEELINRFYKLVKFDAQGRLHFRPHFEARPASDLNEEYKLRIGQPQDQVRVTANNLNVLVEGVDFTINILGKLERIHE